MAYVELHAHSCYSLLDGASTPEALVQRAAALDMPALSLTEHDALYSAPELVRAARAAGIHAIFGAELTLHDHSHLTLLVQDARGWANLCALISAARHHAPKGEACLSDDDLLVGHAAGLIALSGCRRGRVTDAIMRGDMSGAQRHGAHLRDLFGADNLYIEMQHHRRPDDHALNLRRADLARALRLPVVATNNVHYAEQAGHRLHDVLLAIREKTPLDHAGTLYPNSERSLKSAAELAPLFRDFPGALERTGEIAARCTFVLGDALQTLPLIPTPPGMDADAYLRHLCSAGGLTEREQAQLAHELAVIRAAGLSNYFLVVWDIVRYAREQGILCQGRGSAANSLVAWRLGISPIHPFDHGLVFERFLSAERRVVPDIDIDFDAARREEVIQYVYRKYGHASAAMACTFSTFRARSAVRDVGKALGLPLEILEHVASALDTYQARDVSHSAALREVLGTQLDNPIWRQITDLTGQIDRLPRHLGIHNGGMVISAAPLSQRVPTEPATMPDRYVVQWDKDGLEDMGLIKIDILGLRMLSVLADCAALIRAHDPAFTFDGLTCDDPAVYEMICRADTVGVFQVESHAQMQVLPRLKPRAFNDLVISISLIRPGPVQGNMVHPYLRRRDGVEAVDCFHPLLEPALGETLGVILFQEQVLKVARDAAGFTPGQGELLRRALGSKDPETALQTFRPAFLTGAVERGIAPETAELIFDKLRAFAGYSFAKSHAASFAVIVYRSAWLKLYHPAEFAAALLNNQPMGFWSESIIVNDAKRHGLTVHGVDINRSAARSTTDGPHIHLGLSLVKGLGEQADAIVTARGSRPFADLRDFCARVRLARGLVEALILAGAMDAWGERRALLWQLGEIEAWQRTPLPLAAHNEPVALPGVSADEAQYMEAGAVGFAHGQHPLARHRAALEEQRIVFSDRLAGLKDGAWAQVVGLLVMHQAPPTAKGFHFLTLEDEAGMISVIVRPKIYARFRAVIRHAPVVILTGRIQHENAVTNILAEHFAAWKGRL
ncbi:MAG: error-prone DNA polymerase [Pleurocapsa minor GSE-CHR-MK-17-07R]|jgi:error-prone DNA polymerase|nr:error-prone DNA polymerase [Pleurocapsa minor GSE-CHR-MK 17-07R]